MYEELLVKPKVFNIKRMHLEEDPIALLLLKDTRGGGMPPPRVVVKF